MATKRAAETRHTQLPFSPRVGQILECNYGNYPASDEQDLPPETAARPHNYDLHIPPEMVKNRLVVVLNGKLGGSCVVVPLSTTQDQPKLEKGLHVAISRNEIPNFHYFRQEERWAKADMVQQVSKARLRVPRGEQRGTQTILSNARVADIQKAVIKAINAASLLTTEATPSSADALNAPA